MKVPYKIYRDPLPEMRGRAPRYPFAEMCIGECFYVPVSQVKSRANLDAMTRMWAKRHGKEWKFAVREVDDEQFGVWRLS